MRNRIISMGLAVSLCLSLLVTSVSPASAAFDYNPQVSQGSDFRSALSEAFAGFFKGIKIDTFSNVLSAFVFTRTGLVTYEQLEDQQTYYNSTIARLVRSLTTNFLIDSAVDSYYTSAVIGYDKANGIFRLADSATGNWIFDSQGRFPYFEVVAAGMDSVMELPKDCNPAPELDKIHGNVWIEDSVAKANLVSHDSAYSYDQLKAFANTLNSISSNLPSTPYFRVASFGSDGLYGLQKLTPAGDGDHIGWLANKNKSPYLTTRDKYQLAVNQQNNYYIQDNSGQNITNENGTYVTTDGPLLDLDNKIFNIPIDNSTTNIDQSQHVSNITYNYEDNSYTVNTWNTTYNTTNNTYVTNNYTWNIKYNITNTYVTYIGSNDNYQKKYEFYYELPDGRSSADLTADEVAALSLQFADTINYTRAATDTNLRALYHFDGNTDDSGYFSTKTEFTWTTGASITYMDSGVFNGALYLDDSPHDFSITLPSYVYAGQDFTVQWRYYQASEADTQNNVENYVSLGGTVLAKWDERYLYNSSGTKLCYLPVGSWMEIAVMRHNGTMYIYCNGVKVGSVSNNAAFSTKDLRFYLGSTSRAYSMFDDLRVLDFAWRENGLAYVPTTVPYDSNLVLVLPGEEKIVDEWLEISSPGNLLDNGDFSVADSSLPSDVTTSRLALSYKVDSFNYFSPSSAVFVDGCLSLASTISSCYMHAGGSAAGLYVRLLTDKTFCGSLTSADYGSNNYFTFSVVDVGGNVYSLTFPFTYSSMSAVFDWGKLMYYYKSDGDDRHACVFIVVNAGCSINLLYADLVRGETPGVTVTKHADVYDLSTLQPNTAAIQSSIPVTGYTVGGVRPTFPERGNVWFAVESGRISSVQLYTGSAWESVTARWWTGERWIPIYAFDVFTLEDCYDIADTDDVTTPITSETGGWNWWKGQWKDFRAWLASNTGTGGSGSGGGGDGNAGGGSGSGGSYDYPTSYPTVPGDGETGEDVTITDEDGHEVSIWEIPGMLTKAFRSVLKGSFSATAGGITGVFTIVKDGTFDFFNAFDDGLTVQSVDGYTEKYTVYDYFNIPEDELWD